MNDRCTPAAARRLKELGFAQPAPAPGQVWYKDEKPWLRMPGAYWVELINGFTHSNPQFTPDCYAPTAPDILRELGFVYELSFASDLGGFICTGDFPAIFSNENNPAEACALAWEAKQKP